MLKQLGLVDLLFAIQNKVETKTKLKCYDSVPDNVPSPFYFVEVISKRPTNSKTMFKDVFIVWVHAIASPNDSSIEVYEMVKKLEEALTEDIELEDDYDLIMQVNNGIQTIKTDETNEKHAVIEYQFTVCYGFKTKTGGF